MSSDPLWFKDAVFYEAPVKSFFDSDNNGIGDFRGMAEKLDYIRQLGVDCIWLLPMYPSPYKDDGYDISDFVSIHHEYGTVADFKALLDAAQTLPLVTDLRPRRRGDLRAVVNEQPGYPYARGISRVRKVRVR